MQTSGKGRLFAIVLISGSFLASSPFGRGGRETQELTGRANQAFGGLPQVLASEKNPVTAEKVELGKILFYETRISVDGTVSCAKCHPFSLYAADGLRTSVGNRCRTNPRNAPTVLNAAGQIAQHWLGNRVDVEDQARQSVVGPASFGMSSPADVEKILKGIQDYAPLFKRAFPADDDPTTVDNLAKAIGAFERTLVTPSPFDSFLAGQKEALTEQQQSGLNAFLEAGCVTCHEGPYVGGRMFQKFGLLEPYWTYTKSEPVDEGRSAVTKNDADRYVFKVPGLRNVAKTGPYFHDGSVDDLETAILIMGRVQLGQSLPPEKLRDIKAFLMSLTGKIPDDALRLPLLPAKE